MARRSRRLASHPTDAASRRHGTAVPIPEGEKAFASRLSLNVHYELPSVTGLTLASGNIYSAHADFFNAWNQALLSRLVRTSLN